MTFLFWLLWLLNLSFIVLVLWASGYRSGFGAGVDLNTILVIGVVVILVASLIVRFGLKKHGASVGIVGLPILGLLFWYLWEKIQKM